MWPHSCPCQWYPTKPEFQDLHFATHTVHSDYIFYKSFFKQVIGVYNLPIFSFTGVYETTLVTLQTIFLLLSTLAYLFLKSLSIFRTKCVKSTNYESSKTAVLLQIV